MNPADQAAALRAEIWRTREELSETLEALAAKANVKARLGRTLAQPAVRWRIAACGGVVLLVAAGLVVLRRWRR